MENTLSEELEITPRRKEDFYTLMQAKMLDLIKQGEIYFVNFKRAVRRAKIESIASILGHALGTASYRPFLHTALDTLQVEDIRRLPERSREDMAWVLFNGA